MTKRVGGTRSPSTHYETSRHCIAYLDILGGTNIINKDEKNEHLNNINMIYCDAINESKMFTLNEKIHFCVKIFSDNLLLAIKTNDENRQKNILKIVNLVSNIIEEMADYGYLMRGSITEGDFFFNEIMVYGKGLVEAVKMEEKYAIYPRIIVKKEIADSLPQYFFKCADGWDMLNNYIFSYGAFDHLCFRNTLLNQLRNNKNDIKIVQKIMWAISFFNLWHKSNTLTAHAIITDKEIDDATK